MGIIKNFKSRKTMGEINRLNNNKLEIYNQVSGIYRGGINLNYDEIKFPENVTSKEYVYDDDGGLQIFILNEDGDKIAIINCLQTKKALAEIEKEKAQQLEIEKEKMEKERQEDEKRKANQEELLKKLEQLNTERYDSCIDFLKQNGASEEIINMPAIQELIKDVISAGDQRLIIEGKSPIVYERPNSDGTFNISGKTAGPTANLVYKMSYCNDGNENHFIQLVIENETTVHYAMDDPIGDSDGYKTNDSETIYINRDGEIIDRQKTRKTM